MGRYQPMYMTCPFYITWTIPIKGNVILLTGRKSVKKRLVHRLDSHTIRLATSPSCQFSR